MAFNNYKEIGQVQSEFQIRQVKQNFIAASTVEPSNDFVREINFTTETIDFQASEAARTETIIFPVLREVYKSYHEKFALWIQKPIALDEKLCGTPDYMISVKSPLGKKVLEKPLLAVVEAKKNDFEYGWGQCLAEMYAVQQINENADLAIYGIVTDGEIWQFGELTKDVFTQNIASFSVGDLPKLFGALHFVFQTIAARL